MMDPFAEFPDGVLIADADRRVEYVNRRIEEMARAFPGELIGLHIDEAMPFDDLNGNSWYNTVRPYDGLAIRTRVSEQSWWSPRGSEYLITARLVRERPAGRVVRVSVSVRDALIRNQRDRERSDLIATVAHELRSPLTGIKGFTSTLLGKWDHFSDEQRQFMLETVDSDADRLTRLIYELLDAARIDAGRLTLRPGPVWVVEIVRSVLGSFSVGAGYPTALEPVVVGDPPMIWADADRITEVVTNLVENAARHGHGLLEVVVRATGVEEARGDRNEPGVLLSVHDRGPGIPVDMRQRVFSRFWRSGPESGSGLGMYIVRGIAHSHGGTTEIDDDPRGGAIVSVWLPVNEPDALND